MYHRNHIRTPRFAKDAATKNYVDTVAEKIVAGTGPTDWNDVTSKPSTFPPSAHVHPVSDVSGLQGQIDGKVAKTGDTMSGDLTARSFKVAGAPSDVWGLSPYITISMATNATYDLAFGSGLVGLYLEEGGSAGLVMLIYGGIYFIVNAADGISGAQGTANKINIYYNAGNGRYRIENKWPATKTLNISLIQLRGSS